jgi:hypothetical protein
MVEKPPRNDENKENGGSVAAFFAQVSNITGSPPSPELPTALRPQMNPLQNLFEDPAVVSVLPLEITILNFSLDLSRSRLEKQPQIKFNENTKNVPRKYCPTIIAQPLAQNSEKYLIIFNKNSKNIPKNAKIIPKKYHPTYIAQPLAQKSEKYQIKSNKIAENIPKNAKIIPKKYPLAQNSEKYLGRQESGSVRLMGQSKCRPKNQNHPYTRPLTPKKPMKQPWEHGFLSRVNNGARLSDALMKMMIEKEYLAYQNKYVEIEIHTLWLSQNNQIEQAAIPLGSQCHQHPTNSLVFCFQCTTENPAQTALGLGKDTPPRDVQPEAAQSAPALGGGDPLESATAEAAEAFVSEATETTTHAAAQAAANEAATHAAAQGAVDAATPPGGFQAGDVQPGVGRGVNSVKKQSAPFGSMEYMPEAWRNFKINLDDFLPASPDPEMIQLLLNFVL